MTKECFLRMLSPLISGTHLMVYWSDYDKWQHTTTSHPVLQKRNSSHSSSNLLGARVRLEPIRTLDNAESCSHPMSLLYKNYYIWKTCSRVRIWQNAKSLVEVSGPNMFPTLVNSLLRDPRTGVVNSYLWTSFLIAVNVNKGPAFKGCLLSCQFNGHTWLPSRQNTATYATRPSWINICLEIIAEVMYLNQLWLHEIANTATETWTCVCWCGLHLIPSHSIFPPSFTSFSFSLPSVCSLLSPSFVLRVEQVRGQRFTFLQTHQCKPIFSTPVIGRNSSKLCLLAKWIWKYIFSPPSNLFIFGFHA